MRGVQCTCLSNLHKYSVLHVECLDIFVLTLKESRLWTWVGTHAMVRCKTTPSEYVETRRQYRCESRLQSSPFLSLNQRTTRVRGRRPVWDARTRGTGEKGGKRKVPRGRASHTSRLPRGRVDRWLGEKTGTASRSNVKEELGFWFKSFEIVWYLNPS